MIKEYQEAWEGIARRVSKSVECRDWECLCRKVQLDYLEIASLILNLKGDGWKIAIITEGQQSPYPEYFHLKQVLWEADDA